MDNRDVLCMIYNGNQIWREQWIQGFSVYTVLLLVTFTPNHCVEICHRNQPDLFDLFNLFDYYSL